MPKPAILVIDDEESLASMVSAYLEAKGYRVAAALTGEEALEEIASGGYDIVVSDIYIDEVTGLDILRAAKGQRPDCAVILMTARGSVETTVEAEAGGAFEYLAKPFEMGELLEAVQRAEASLGATPPEDAGEEAVPPGGMIGHSPPMVRVYKAIARSARSEETVLITGESGTGKELVARAIHEHSPRSGKPFLPVDCGAIPGSLWESEVFGSVRGAFTGADRDRKGIVETAAGGTVFFDEVGEIPLEFQPKLLRFLQEREYRPVGAASPRKADVRVIAATNRPLERMVQEGKFREDLFHRLNVIRIDVPPLRERRDDIPMLARHFLEQALAGGEKRLWLEEEAVAELKRYDWPGNVRQLENLMRRLAALSPPGPLTADAVREALRPPEEGEEETGDLSEVERRHILKVLEQTGGNKTKAAEILGIQRRTLYKKLARIRGERSGHTGVPE